MITACSDNAWNNHLDGFDGSFSYTEKTNISYTLTNSDYETIGKALASKASTEEETAAAKAIQANHYFDQSSVYPAQIALPYLFDDTSSDYFIYNNGSVVEATFRQANSTPEEISKISSAYTLTVSSPTSEGKLPALLKDKYPDASEGQYAIVSYLDESNSAVATPSVGSTIKTTNYKPVVATRSASVWSVSEALLQMSYGYEGEATVIGVISSIDDVSTSYGNATYYIKDNLSDEASLEVFRGYFLDGEKFTSEDQIKVGATVIITGQLVNYNGTYEFTSGSSLLNYFEESIWTVSETLAMMSDGYEGEGIVRGVISSIDDVSTSYGNATYYIKDNLSDEASLEVFRGYFLDGEKFTSEDQIKVGATVIISGELINYNGTYEFTSGSKILSYFGESGATGSDNLTDNIKNLNEGEILSATAVVSAQCTRGLILTDNGGSILYYNTEVDLSQYPIGTVVNVSGEISSYNKGFQLSNSATIETVETITYNYPEPVEYTGEMITQACSGTENMTAQYCSIKGVVSFSGNYTNIAISGTDVQGSAYYIPDYLKEELEAGSTYQFYGYFTSFTSSYFYIVVTSFEEITPDVDPYSLVNEIYYYDGSSWDVAENASVVNPVGYKQMGFSNNDLSDPEIYLPLYLKVARPYALPGEEVYVAYNLRTNSASCDLLVYDGSTWTLNNNGLETVTAALTKTDGEWKFTKYLGKAVFDLFEEEEIVRDRTYMIVSGDYCANPVLATNSYGYLLTTVVSISGTQITMPNENNGFKFLSSFEVDGKVINVPDGFFVIQDSNERFMYLQGTYSSFNVTANTPALNEDGSISEGYLFSATKNSDGSWTINNNREGNVRNLYFSSKYTNFAAYTDQSADDTFPFLYILEAE